MILAAGLGTRMKPLTDHTPKPLLQAAGKPLIQYHIEGLVKAGIKDIVINTSWLGSQIEQFLGDGSAFGARIHCSHEETPLETAGGIIKALPLLVSGLTESTSDLTETNNSEDYFIVINGDVWTDFNYKELISIFDNLQRTPHSSLLAHLVMVSNPPQHPKGDFYLFTDGVLSNKPPETNNSEKLTFSGISLLNKNLFNQCHNEIAPLAPLLRDAMKNHQVTGHKASCTWMDIGTPERLSHLEQHLR